VRLLRWLMWDCLITGVCSGRLMSHALLRSIDLSSVETGSDLTYNLFKMTIPRRHSATVYHQLLMDVTL